MNRRFVSSVKVVPLSFPLWLVASHYLNLLFMVFLGRSGLQILGAFPRFYLHDGCTPGREIFKFTRKLVPRAGITQSLDQELDMPGWLALPGGRSLGIGRHWHFLALLGWILTGLIYVLLLLITDEWRRLIPTSWSVFPDALQAATTYLHFRLPTETPGMPYNALQQLAYFAVVFLLSPFQIATGAAMSPAISARAPWYPCLFGGRQPARTLHFLGLLAFAAFVAVHTAMVVIHGLPQELAKMALGQPGGSPTGAVLVGGAGLLFIVLLNVAANIVGRRRPRLAQKLLAPPIDLLQRELSYHLRSRQRYSRADISPYHWVNGYPPADSAYQELVRNGFAEYRLLVSGLVATPLQLALTELREMGRESQVVKHNCIQGWSGIAQWTGIPLSTFIQHCRPLPAARYLVFHAFDNKAQTQPGEEEGYYYETLDLKLGKTPQTILAYEMNGAPLPVEHGAPLRLRVEVQLGFKMVKWIRAIEFVDDYRKVGQGQGGWREDHVQYSRVVGI